MSGEPAADDSRTSRRWGHRAIGAAWAIVLLAVLFNRIQREITRPEAGSPDEPYWIGSTYYFDLLTRGDMHHPDWQLLPARENPPVGKYLFGLALRAAGRRIDSIDLLGAWQMPFLVHAGTRGPATDEGKRHALIRRMSPSARAGMMAGTFRPLGRTDMAATRGLILGVGYLAALGIMALGARCDRPWTGRLAALLFVLHPVAVACYQHVLVDMIALAFSIGAIGVLIALGEGSAMSLARVAGLGALEGLALGLACGTKMNALVAVVTAGAVGLTLLARGVRTGDRRWMAMGPAGVVAIAVFVGLNPTLYPDPIGGLIALFDEPARTVRFQASFLPGHAATPSAKLRTLAGLLSGGMGGLIALVILTAWRTAVAARGPGGWMVVPLWWWVALGTVGLWIPFPWDRYALPLLPPLALLTADAALAVVRGTVRLARGPSDG